MRRLRTRWGSRVAVAVMVASLLPVATAPTAQVIERVARVWYASWLRAQLAEAPGEAFDAALAAASARPSASFDDFLSAFVRAFEARNPQAALVVGFRAHYLSTGALLTDLRGQFAAAFAQHLAPLVVLVSAPATVGPHSSTPAWTPAALLPSLPRLAAATVTGVYRSGGPLLFVVPIRVLWSALPLGP